MSAYAIVQIAFPAAVQIANALRQKTPMDFNIGGSIGRFGSPGGQIDWPIDSLEDVDAVCNKTLEGIGQWAVPLLEAFETPEAAIENFDRGVYTGVIGWEDLVALYALVLEASAALAKRAPLPNWLVGTGRILTENEIERRLGDALLHRAIPF